MSVIQENQSRQDQHFESSNHSEGRDSCCRTWFYNPICSCMSTILSPIKSVLTLLCSSCINCYSSLCGRAAPQRAVHIGKANMDWNEFVIFATENGINFRRRPQNQPSSQDAIWHGKINSFHAAYKKLCISHPQTMCGTPPFAMAVIERPNQEHPGSTIRFLAILLKNEGLQRIPEGIERPYGRVEELSADEARQSSYTHFVRFQ